jgi:N-acetyl sugar amidotransferase
MLNTKTFFDSSSSCSNCVMDTTDTKISFDTSGVCDHCNTYFTDIEQVWNYGKGREGELNRLIENIRIDGRGKDFDCLMGVSGGIDSSFLLYKMTHDYGLRPLVFHVDAGWNTQIAVNNIEKLVDGLGLDLYTEVINWEEIKDLQLAFFKSGVPHVDVPQDHAFFGTMYKFASKHKIKNILTGGNYSTECVRNPLEWMYYQSDSIQLKDIHSKYGSINLDSYPITNILWYKVYLPYIKGIKLYRPLDYIEYNKQEAMNLLESKFGYQKYPQKHFESRFTRFYESYWLYERFGYDVRKVQFSSLILTGQMTREEALEELKKLPYDKETIHLEFEYVATKLGITVNELQSYFEMPKRTYKGYKSQESIYLIGAKVMRMLGLERGGKR